VVAGREQQPRGGDPVAAAVYAYLHRHYGLTAAQVDALPEHTVRWLLALDD
jgi:hypothetical protein